MLEQDYAEIGRIVSQRKELQAEIDAIADRLRKQGNDLKQLGDLLAMHPERVVFTGQSTEMRYRGPSGPLFTFGDGLIPAIKESTNRLREKMTALTEVERKAAQFGI